MQITIQAYHKAIDQLFKHIKDEGYEVNKVSAVSLTKRFNSKTGEHVHATCSIKLRFDVSVSESDIEREHKFASS